MARVVDAENILRELVIGMVCGIDPHSMSRVVDQILQSCFVFDCPSKFPQLLALCMGPTVVWDYVSGNGKGISLAKDDICRKSYAGLPVSPREGHFCYSIQGGAFPQRLVAADDQLRQLKPIELQLQIPEFIHNI